MYDREEVTLESAAESKGLACEINRILLTLSTGTLMDSLCLPFPN